MSYQKTSLWRRTLGKNDPDVKPLRDCYIDARKNAEFLLSKIREDFPFLTIHDISHVDSLWNVADTIIGHKYKINPLEGFVLGISFLIHDAALSYDAVGGRAALEATPEWQDANAEDHDGMNEDEFRKQCDFTAIRVLHARYAETILDKKFTRSNGTTFFIIDDDSYREHFKDLIGKIAASHHWGIDDLTSLQSQVNPRSGMPKEWTINPRKLACILRCADAGHIDNGRAPDNIYNSLLINGVSRDHWESQNHLCQVCEDFDDPTKLRITSTKPFPEEESASWNVAYDAVRIFDNELKKSNNLLKPYNLQFPYTGVSGANSKQALSNYIQTKGWMPLDFSVHTSNVKALIENLGGSKLYGGNNLLLVALRELIQNARDAIHATSKLFNHDGRIIVRHYSTDSSRWIEVIDNGIGMSIDCIKDYLLDFGSSYWKSSLSKKENTGLLSKGFSPIGKFGIGFYSVFMVAKSVEVVTRRFGTDFEKANIIKFPKGLTLSPIYAVDKMNPNISTSIKIELKNDIELSFVIKKKTNPKIKQEISLQQVLSILTAGLDADVYYEEDNHSCLVHTNPNSPSFNKEDWLRGILFNCPRDFGTYASKLEEIKDKNGKLRGLIMPPIWEDRITTLFSDLGIPSLKMIGGLLSSLDIHKLYSFYPFEEAFMGYIDGKGVSITRNEMIFDESIKECLRDWIIYHYHEDHDIIMYSPSLCAQYNRLIKFANIQDDIILYNINHIYDYIRFTKTDSINDLLNLHSNLFAGVLINVKRIRIDHISQSQIEPLLDLHDDSWKKYISPQNKKDGDFLNELLLVLDLPASTDNEIICKFCKLLALRPFLVGNIVTLRVWLNMSLRSKSYPMINWDKVDQECLNKKVEEKKYDYACNYLKSFESWTCELSFDCKDLLD